MLALEGCSLLPAASVAKIKCMVFTNLAFPLSNSVYACHSPVTMQDVPSQDGKPWTRFVFNNEALLEEEGAAPDSPAVEGKGPVELGAFDFRPHRSQQIGKPAEDAHEVNSACFDATVLLTVLNQQLLEISYRS